MAGMQFGTLEAVRLKFFIVRDIIRKGDRSRLDDVRNQLADPFPIPQSPGNRPFR